MPPPNTLEATLYRLVSSLTSGVRFDLYVHHVDAVSGAAVEAKLAELETKLDRLLTNQQHQTDEELSIMTSLTDLQTEVAAVKADFANAVLAIQGESAQIKDLTARLAAMTAGGADSVSAADVAAVTADLKASSTNLETLLASAAAATAPAAPAAVPGAEAVSPFTPNAPTGGPTGTPGG